MGSTKRRSTRAARRTLVVVALMVAATTAFLGPVTTINQSQQTTLGTSSKLSQVVASRTASWSSLAVKWTQSVYSYSGSVIAADIDGDGRPEVLINGEYELYCLNGMGDVKWKATMYGYGSSTPAVADIDGDGKMEIVVTDEYHHYLICLDSTGVRKWTDNSARWFAYSPTIADIDQDGRPEILVGSSNYYNQSDPCRLFCMDGSGGVKWSYATGATISSSSTVADVQGDGKLEVVVSGSNKTYCLNAAGASVWNFTSAGRTRFSPAVADVDGDGRKEVVVGWSDGSVYCLNASGILKWSYQTGYEEYLSYSSVADLDGDGRPEIVFSSGGKTIYCLDGSGKLKWSHPIDASVSHPPTLANVDMDNDLEIVFGTSDGYSSGQWVNGGIVYCLNGSGVTEWTYATGDSIYNPPVVADIDLDGNPEVVVLVGSLAYCLTAFPAPQVLIPGSVAIVLVGLVSALIAMTAVTMVRRNRGVRTGSRRRRRGTAYGSRR